MFDYTVNVFYGKDSVVRVEFIAVESAEDLERRIKAQLPTVTAYQVMRVVTNAEYWYDMLEAVGFQQIVEIK